MYSNNLCSFQKKAFPTSFVVSMNGLKQTLKFGYSTIYMAVEIWQVN